MLFLLFEAASTGFVVRRSNFWKVLREAPGGVRRDVGCD